MYTSLLHDLATVHATSVCLCMCYVDRVSCVDGTISNGFTLQERAQSQSPGADSAIANKLSQIEGRLQVSLCNVCTGHC